MLNESEVILSDAWFSAEVPGSIPSKALKLQVSFLVLFLFIFIHLYDRAEHTCEDPLTPLESELFTFPKFIPIDWFDPGYWNAVLTVHECLDYVEHGYIGLHLVEHCQTWERCSLWKNLPEEEFMERYGNSVLEQYKMPTKEEIEQL